jgi:transposase
METLMSALTSVLRSGSLTRINLALGNAASRHDLDKEDRRCACGGDLSAFGEEISRELERVETTVVHEIVRKKYACGSCREGVVTAPWRGKVIDNGLLGPGFLAHVIVERFGNHLPYYRLQAQYRDEGLDLSRSVLCESTARCAELLEPIGEEIKRQVLASEVIHTDDTPVTVARSREGGSRQGRVWVYLNREGRHWYEFTSSRKRDGTARVLKEFQGFLQADAYGGYDGLFLPGGCTEVACWAHLRRKWIDAEATDPELSKSAVDQIRLLFQIEELGAELTEEQPWSAKLPYLLFIHQIGSEEQAPGTRPSGSRTAPGRRGRFPLRLDGRSTQR